MPALARNAVLIFAKLPRPGRVKTRLLTTLTAKQAAEVHLACVRDTTEMASSAGGYRKVLLLAGRPGTAKQLARQIGLSRSWDVGVQEGRDLGARLRLAFEAEFRRGMQKVVVIGTDTPWMGRARLRRAFMLLGEADVVLGPTEDGGYYLVGARRLVPEMFRGIPWGTSRVLQRTLGALRRSRVRYRLLACDFDLDRPGDLQRVGQLLRRKKIHAPNLKRWMAAWLRRAPSRR